MALEGGCMNKKNNLEFKCLVQFITLLCSLGGALFILIKYQPQMNLNAQEPKTHEAIRLKKVTYKSSPTSPKMSSNNNTTHIEATTHNIEIPEKANLEVETTQPLSASNNITMSLSEADNLLQNSIELVNSGKVNEAKHKLEEILKDHPDHDIALAELGMIYALDLKDPQTAKSYFEKSLALNVDNKAALAELLNIYEDETGSPDNLKFLQSLAENNPNNSHISLGVGHMLMDSSPREALNHLESAANNGMVSAYDDLAETYSDLGELDKTFDAYKRKEQLIQEKIEQGDYEQDPQLGTERLIDTKLHQVEVLIEQGKASDAREVIDEILPHLKNSNELLTLFDEFEGHFKNSSNKY